MYTNGLSEPPGAAFRRLVEKASSLGVTPEQLARLYSVQRLKRKPVNKKVRQYALAVVSTLVLILAISLATEWPVSRRTLAEYYFDYRDQDIEKESCALDWPDALMDVVRPPVPCGFCEGLDAVDRVQRLSPEAFETRYAYSGVPVVVTDATKNWTAPEVFTFQFFKGIYADDSPVLRGSESNCQFFPYKTDFKNLQEVFTMDDERAQLKDGAEPWYIGWSNCDSSAANILRQHYERPYFLPRVSESSKTDWIFMGSPGYGAHMHIDNVGNPSWQAQITGSKEWTLEPPAECYHVCPNQVKVPVNPGDIIVLDTNIWYHSTLITGKELSIVIGSEYD